MALSCRFENSRIAYPCGSRTVTDKFVSKSANDGKRCCHWKRRRSDIKRTAMQQRVVGHFVTKFILKYRNVLLPYLASSGQVVTVATLPLFMANVGASKGSRLPVQSTVLLLDFALFHHVIYEQISTVTLSLICLLRPFLRLPILWGTALSPL
jgi:hypothetical protein